MTIGEKRGKLTRERERGGEKINDNQNKQINDYLYKQSYYTQKKGRIHKITHTHTHTYKYLYHIVLLKSSLLL